ncbi:unnamed protein product [Clavelina lepadiformis]|uniref:Uncharacterized protein n=1 Tax=Clavelina lepadiformis TaxID=159417 RepID=A0ABP0F157_CLALP
MRSEQDVNREAKALLDRLSLDLEQQLSMIEIAKKHQLQRIRKELRDINAFYKILHKHGGHCPTAAPTTDKEADEIRKKFRCHPRMVFGEDFQAGFSAVLARKEYRKNFDLNLIILRFKSKKKLSWPNT